VISHFTVERVTQIRDGWGQFLHYWMPYLYASEGAKERKFRRRMSRKMSCEGEVSREHTNSVSSSPGRENSLSQEDVGTLSKVQKSSSIIGRLVGRDRFREMQLKTFDKSTNGAGEIESPVSDYDDDFEDESDDFSDEESDEDSLYQNNRLDFDRSMAGSKTLNSRTLDKMQSSIKSTRIFQSQSSNINRKFLQHQTSSVNYIKLQDSSNGALSSKNLTRTISKGDRRNSIAGNKKDDKSVDKLLRRMSIEKIQQIHQIHHQLQEHRKAQDQKEQENYEKEQEVLLLRRRVQELENQINNSEIDD